MRPYTHLCLLVCLLISIPSARSLELSKADVLGQKKTSEPDQVPIGMVAIPGGTLTMGANDPNHPIASPPHKVNVGPFWMDKYETTNAQWAQFVKATGYKTIAERVPDPKYFPSVDPKAIRKHPPFSLVFSAPERLNRRGLQDHRQWWALSKGADWKHPEGPKSNIKKRMKYPVVHISWIDAVEYCNWRSKQGGLKPAYKKVKTKEQYVLVPKANGFRLPTEAEWEFAARGGLAQKKNPWGNKRRPMGKWMANVWQGNFRSRTPRKMDTIGQRRLGAIHRTDTDYMIWPGTSGSGVTITIEKTITPTV